MYAAVFHIFFHFFFFVVVFIDFCDAAFHIMPGLMFRYVKESTVTIYEDTDFEKL